MVYKLSPNEEETVIKEEIKKRRLQRLKEVREQSKLHSAKLRTDYEKEKEKLKAITIEKNKKEWQEEHEKDLMKLQEEMGQVMRQCGQGGRNAQALNDLNLDEAKRMKVIADAKKASERFKKALKDLQQDKQECILKNNQHLFDRQASLEVEKHRTNQLLQSLTHHNISYGMVRNEDEHGAVADGVRRKGMKKHHKQPKTTRLAGEQKWRRLIEEQKRKLIYERRSTSQKAADKNLSGDDYLVADMSQEVNDEICNVEAAETRVINGDGFDEVGGYNDVVADHEVDEKKVEVVINDDEDDDALIGDGGNTVKSMHEAESPELKSTQKKEGLSSKVMNKLNEIRRRIEYDSDDDTEADGDEGKCEKSDDYSKKVQHNSGKESEDDGGKENEDDDSTKAKPTTSTTCTQTVAQPTPPSITRKPKPFKSVTISTKSVDLLKTKKLSDKNKQRNKKSIKPILKGSKPSIMRPPRPQWSRGWVVDGDGKQSMKNLQEDRLLISDVIDQNAEKYQAETSLEHYKKQLEVFQKMDEKQSTKMKSRVCRQAVNQKNIYDKFQEILSTIRKHDQLSSGLSTSKSYPSKSHTTLSSSKSPTTTTYFPPSKSSTTDIGIQTSTLLSNDDPDINSLERRSLMPSYESLPSLQHLPTYLNNCGAAFDVEDQAPSSSHLSAINASDILVPQDDSSSGAMQLPSEINVPVIDDSDGSVVKGSSGVIMEHQGTKENDLIKMALDIEKEKLELTMMLKRIHNGNVEKDKKRTSFPSFLSTHSSTHYLQLPGYQSLQEDESHDDASSKSNDVDDSFSATEMKDKQRINSFILTSIKEENVEYTQSEKRSQMHSSFESLNDELSDRINKLLQSMKKDCQVTEEKSEQESNHVMGHHHQNINISLVSNSAGQSDGVSSNPQNDAQLLKASSDVTVCSEALFQTAKQLLSNQEPFDTSLVDLSHISDTNYYNFYYDNNSITSGDSDKNINLCRTSPHITNSSSPITIISPPNKNTSNLLNSLLFDPSSKLNKWTNILNSYKFDCRGESDDVIESTTNKTESGEEDDMMETRDQKGITEEADLSFISTISTITDLSLPPIVPTIHNTNLSLSQEQPPQTLPTNQDNPSKCKNSSTALPQHTDEHNITASLSSIDMHHGNLLEQLNDSKLFHRVCNDV